MAFRSTYAHTHGKPLLMIRPEHRLMETVKAVLMEAFQARFRFAGGRFVAAATQGEPQGAERFGPNQWRAVGRDVRLLHEAYTSGKGNFRHQDT
ncbi:MAG: hypothetical protein IIA14_12165, partial [SAR324 cluster bacterium]|nr:hypothetical protein [SAR324 cluster bacterium]